MSSFILLRPWLLLLSIPLIWWWKQHKQDQQQAWFSILPDEIASFLGAKRKPGQQHAKKLHLLIGLLGVIALSGPSLLIEQKLEYRDETARVIVLDTSYSMNARDVKPNRMQLAKFKLLDLLEFWRSGETGLVVVAGDAFVISPLSTDIENLKNYIPHLGPEIMPVHGSAIELGIQKAVDLFAQSGLERGDILLVSDGMSSQSVEASLKYIAGSNLRISVLALGSEQGAPIALGDGQQMRDSDGSVVISKMKFENFTPLCQQTNGLCLKLEANDQDIQQLLALPALSSTPTSGELSHTALNYQDFGYYLLFPILVLLGISSFYSVSPILVAFLTFPLLSPSQVHAQTTSSWWTNQQQQAQQLFENQDYGQAAEQFEDPQWQGSSLYRAGEFEKAKAKFELDQSAVGKYNQGNALAQLGELDAAIESYQQALSLDPNLSAAQQNIELLQKLKEQQQQQQQSESSNDEQSDDQQSNQQSSGKQQAGESSPGQESKDQQPASEQEQSPQQENGEQPGAGLEPEANNQTEPQQQQPSKSQGEASDEELQKWLEQLPNDPSLLLRNRMILEYKKRRQQPQSKEPW
ncbi:VWA domain-containing protein [Alginatibacterium sediminis]|uniref:VWA domain-containing protein n=1 Tax=Alginatibacterium sediminis TaxID=2164068 RepID=A0A420EG33_9ALTE|nr:VWA domain-containing protein [Alginatibacterium sediminis]RKF19671.1 VWA domain-containing protein [Alginatibacterium sediminis]